MARKEENRKKNKTESHHEITEEVNKFTSTKENNVKNHFQMNIN